MKITNFESFHLRVPYDEPELRGEFCELLYLRIDTDEGQSGWGQAWSMKLGEATRWVIDQAVAPMCIGQDALETNDWMARLLKTHGNTRQGPFTYAVSALDIALWDLKGKATGQPLNVRLGGTQKSKLGAYASLIFYGDAERTAEKAKEAVERGYRDIKLHEEAIEPVRAARICRVRAGRPLAPGVAVGARERRRPRPHPHIQDRDRVLPGGRVNPGRHKSPT